MPWYPLSWLIVFGVKTLVTKPRCCRAKRPKNTVWATPSPCGVEMPKTPHSSRGESVSSSESAFMVVPPLEAFVDRVGARPEWSCGELLVGVDVAARGGLPHAGLEQWRGSIAGVAGVEQRPADDLFVEAFRFVAGSQ